MAGNSEVARVDMRTMNMEAMYATTTRRASVPVRLGGDMNENIFGVMLLTFYR